MYKLLLFFFSISLLLSCADTDSSCTSTFIGGEIINPKSDKVYISREGKTIDTLTLDAKNFFSYEFQTPEKGLYSIRHNEYQVFFLEVGDSLMLRVNTMDFDESLTYSGKGSEKNNLLMELFLMNEEETSIMPMVYQLPPKKFLEKVDSMYSERMIYYNTFISKNNISKEARDLVESSIAYNHFAKKELYVSANADNPVFENGKNLPDDYFDYRNNVNLNDEKLQFYFPYTIYLNRYLDNLAHEANSEAKEYDRNSFSHNKQKVLAIDRLINLESLKDNLLLTATRRYLLNTKQGGNADEMVRLFSDRSSNCIDKKNIDFLAASTSKLTPGKSVPDIQLVSVDNENKKLHELIKTKTVIYFWSSNSVSHYKDIHIQAAELKSKYPEYEFLGINTDKHFKKWIHVVARNSFSKHNEYQLENVEDAAHKLAINSINKAIIVNQKGTILESNANLFDPVIETHLVGYLNQ